MRNHDEPDLPPTPIGRDITPPMTGGELPVPLEAGEDKIYYLTEVTMSQLGLRNILRVAASFTSFLSHYDPGVHPITNEPLHLSSQLLEDTLYELYCAPHCDGLPDMSIVDFLNKTMDHDVSGDANVSPTYQQRFKDAVRLTNDPGVATDQLSSNDFAELFKPYEPVKRIVASQSTTRKYQTQDIPLPWGVIENFEHYLTRSVVNRELMKAWVRSRVWVDPRTSMDARSLPSATMQRMVPATAAMPAERSASSCHNFYGGYYVNTKGHREGMTLEHQARYRKAVKVSDTRSLPPVAKWRKGEYSSLLLAMSQGPDDRPTVIIPEHTSDLHVAGAVGPEPFINIGQQVNAASNAAVHFPVRNLVLWLALRNFNAQGAIAPGVDEDHIDHVLYKRTATSCGNPRCVNPLHIESFSAGDPVPFMLPVTTLLRGQMWLESFYPTHRQIPVAPYTTSAIWKHHQTVAKLKEVKRLNDTSYGRYTKGTKNLGLVTRNHLPIDDLHWSVDYKDVGHLVEKLPRVAVGPDGRSMVKGYEAASRVELYMQITQLQDSCERYRTKKYKASKQEHVDMAHQVYEWEKELYS